MVVDDLTTRERSPGAFWQAASSCIVPMTLSSFIVFRPPAEPGVAMTLMWTTVSTSSLTITLAMTGLRMSARTKETSPMSPRGGTASTPITRATPGSAATARANRRPRSRETPVTRTTLPALPMRRARAYLPSLRRWTRVFFSSLRCFFLAMRLRRFLMTEPTGKPFNALLRSPVGPRDRPSLSGAVARGRIGPSAGAVEALAQVLVDVLLEDAERPADPHGRELAVVDQAVHGHLGDPHHRGHLGNGEELRVGDVPGVGSHRAPILSV